ncbi:hypothetical protein [Bartonella bacilliformis]|uniref:hypothetical protein n=1 Tax=Bartonella bacilliformis TaxID=774 RepID=UPI0039E63CA1
MVSGSDKLCRAISSGSLLLEGSAEIIAAQFPMLQGVCSKINGLWKVATVIHRYEKKSGLYDSHYPKSVE